ncbi:TPA: terminase small subunit [Klebsiella pneumoniae]
MTLNAKQDMFCREFFIGLNALQAAIRVGYSAKTVNRTASVNLSKSDIQTKITELKAQRKDLVGLIASYVLNRLVGIDQMDVLDILTSTDELKLIAALYRKSNHKRSHHRTNKEVTRDTSKLKRALSVWAMTMLIVSCAKNLPAPVVVDTSCHWVRVIYLTDHDIDVLDKHTKRDILAHNTAVQAN